MNALSLVLLSRLRPRSSSIAIATLLAAPMLWAKSNTAISDAGDVQFNEQFLQDAGGQHVDLSRYEHGNPALPGDYVVDTYVNGDWHGRFPVHLAQIGADTNDVEPCMTRELLDRFGVDLTRLTAAAQTALAGGGCPVLAQLIPQASAVFDNGELRLEVSVPQVMLRRSARDWVDPKFWDNGVPAAMLQYNINAYRTHGRGDSSSNLYAGLAGGVNLGPWRLRHRGSLIHDSGALSHRGYRYQQGQTTLQRPLPALKSQLLLGEDFTDGMIFDSVGYRGVRLASDPRMYPQSQRGYAPTVRGIAYTTARVQVRQQGIVLDELTVPPGPFVINDLYPTGYGGDLELQIYESDGRVRTSKIPYAAVVNAVRPGQIRYSLTLGRYRDPDIGLHPWLLEATLRRGLSNAITAYGGLMASQGYQALQGGVALNTRFGAVGLDLTEARARLPGRPVQNGRSLRLSYSKLLTADTNLTIGAYRYSSRNYLSLAETMRLRSPQPTSWQTFVTPVPWPGQGPLFQPPTRSPTADDWTSFSYGRTRSRLELRLDQTVGGGDIYVIGSSQDYWDRRGRDTQFQAGYNGHWRNLTYGITQVRQFDPVLKRWDNVSMLNITMPLGATPSHPLNFTTGVQYGERSGSRLTSNLTGSAGRDNALTYSLNLGRSFGGQAATIAGAGLNYRAPLASLGVTASRENGSQQFGATIYGGIVAYRGGVAFTPTMGDTVAIVEAKGARGARVASGSGLRVDRFGHAVVAGLLPFQQNEVEIDPTGLPMNTELKATAQNIVPTAGAVVPVKFEVSSGGRAVLVEASLPDGQLPPFGAEVTDAQGQAVGVVAQAGRVLLRNLKTDHGAYTIAWGKQARERCRMDLNLPPAKPGDRGWTRVTGICRVVGLQ